LPLGGQFWPAVDRRCDRELRRQRPRQVLRLTHGELSASLATSSSIASPTHATFRRII
jgi:hypothetical protein